MNISEVIKYPILTEKTYAQIESGVYTFAVDKRTNKAEVKKVVEFIFNVEVEKVNIMNIRKKPKKLGRFAGFKSAYKKAIVTLKDGHSIVLFPEEEKNKIKKVDNEKTKSVEEITEIEKKAAERIAKKLADKEQTEKPVVEEKKEELTAKEDQNKEDKE